jgi:hypothetical protein
MMHWERLLFIKQFNVEFFRFKNCMSIMSQEQVYDMNIHPPIPYCRHYVSEMYIKLPQKHFKIIPKHI